MAPLDTVCVYAGSQSGARDNVTGIIPAALRDR